MCRRSLLFIASAILAILLVLTGCTTQKAPVSTTTAPLTTSTPAATATPKAVTIQDKTYRTLSPVGNMPPVQLIPLAPRLDTFDGKTVYVVQGEADPIIMPALYDYLLKNYPKTKWVYYQPSSSFGPSEPDATTLKEANAVIRGVNW
jgi:hypothetical protein